MYVEAEISFLVLTGFIAAIIVYSAMIIKRATAVSADAAVCFCIQIVLLVAAFISFYLIIGKTGTGMDSERNSFHLAVSGVCWALSMIAAALGIRKLIA